MNPNLTAQRRTAILAAVALVSPLLVAAGCGASEETLPEPTPPALYERRGMPPRPPAAPQTGDPSPTAQPAAQATAATPPTQQSPTFAEPPTAPPAASPSPEVTATATATPSPLPSPTPVPAVTPTATATPTRTPVPTPTATPTWTPTRAPSPTPSPTPTAVRPVAIPIGRAIDVPMYNSVIRWEVISLTDPYPYAPPYQGWPPAGQRVVVLYVRATNVGSQAERLFCGDTCTRLILADGSKTSGYCSTLARPFEDVDAKYGGFDLLPGRFLEGEICFQIPAQARVVGFQPNWIRDTPVVTFW